MMKHIKILFMVFVMALVGFSASAQTSNKLHIPDIEAQSGKKIQIPIYLDNTNEIIAMQFDLTLPEGISATQDDVTLTARSENHTVTARNMGGKLRVVVFSPDNSVLRGNSGVLLYINAEVSGALAQNSLLQPVISDAMLSDRAFNNVLSTVEVGKITITPAADLIASQVGVDKAKAGPGDELTISWTVENIGALPTTGGWREQVYLVSGDNSKVIATTYNSDILANGGIMSRNVTATLPEELGVDGTVDVKVRITPNADAGEPVSAQNNNIAIKANALSISKKLTTSIPASVAENGASLIKCMLTRSGNIMAEQIFTFSKTGDNRLTLPEPVKIKYGDASAYFYLKINNDKELNFDPDYTISISGGGYETIDVPFTIVDDEKPQLDITILQTEVTEGETFKIRLGCEYAPNKDVALKLFSDHPERFKLPPTVMLPKGENWVEVDIATIDNNDVSGDIHPTIAVSAEGYMKSEDMFLLKDNDVPTIEFSVTPTLVSEDSGPYAITASIKRTNNLHTKVTVRLSDNSGGSRLRYDKNIVLDKGVQEAQFNIGVIDDNIIQGDAEITLTAGVYIASCSCMAQGESQGIVERKITLIDNDGPALKLDIPNGTWLEGSENNTVKVSHNDKTLGKALSVTLVSDNDDVLEYDHNVTIPAGQMTVNVPVKVKRNDVSDDNKTITFTVTDNANTFARSAAWVMVSDQTLPDALVTDIKPDDNTVYADVPGTIRATIKNQGFATLPDGVKVKFTDSKNEEIGSCYLQEPIAAGETGAAVLENAIVAHNVGDNTIYAEINPEHAVKELLYTNNKSRSFQIQALSPFTLTLDALPTTIEANDSLTITGSTNPVAPTVNVEGMDVEVYVINNGYRNKLTAKADASGKFSVVFKPLSGQVGHFSVGACYPSENKTDEMQAFDIYGLCRTSKGYIKAELATNVETDMTFDITNPSSVAITGIHADIISLPDNVVVNVDPIASLAPGETATVHARVTGTEPSSIRQWYPIELSITSANGTPLNVTIYEFTANLQPKLVGETSSIRTTTFVDRSRTYPFTITNTGKGETGTMTLSLPSWMKSETPTKIASLASGESTQIVLRFEPWEGLVANVPMNGQFAVNCENGGGLAVPYTVTPVSEQTGSLRVNVCDEFTYNTAEAPMVKNARVKLVDGYSNKTINELNTGDDGFVTFSDVPEGYYTLYIYADKHDSYKQNIIISPGQENKVSALLPYQAVSVEWEVVETEVEDEYEIVTTVKYETQVPKPVVILNVPKKIDIDAMAQGEKALYYLTATNVGLITAKDFKLTLPGSNESWSFEFVGEQDVVDLVPQQSVRIPFYFTRLAPNDSKKVRRIQKAPGSGGGCSAPYIGEFSYGCAGFNYQSYANATSQVGSCGRSGGDIGISGGGWGSWSEEGLGTPGPTGGSGSLTSSQNQSSSNTGGFPCDECALKIFKAIAECIISFTPAGCPYGLASGVASGSVVNTAISAAGCIPGPIGMAASAISCGIGAYQAISDCRDSDKEMIHKGKKKDTMIVSANPISIFFIHNYEAWVQILKYYDTMLGTQYDLAGNRIPNSWDKALNEEMTAAVVGIYNHEKGLNVTADDVMNFKPDVVSIDDYRNFAERVIRTMKKERGILTASKKKDASTVDDGTINLDIIKEASDSLIAINEDVKEAGYGSLSELADIAVKDWEKEQEKAQGTVCAGVTLKFEQKLVMTRQAFRGTLTVTNGNSENVMKNIKLDLTVTDKNGNVATSHEFQINPESIDGLNGTLDLGAGWTLNPSTEGKVTILFIPTRYAAPETPTQYNFGGTLTYIDPATDLEVTRTLSPVTLTVNPSPILNLNYFMQRDLYGDDPLTKDVVEPIVPGEFSLIIKNDGFGDATNVKMTTQQPKIIENEKGLFIDFEILSSQLNGRDKTMAMGGSVATNFGTIPAGKTAYAQWALTSPLLGHFVEYDVKATHLTSYDNPDLSLLEDVAIHELTHSVILDESGDVPLMGFLANDVKDFDCYPDHIYLTDGTDADVSVTQDAVIEKISDTKYRLTVTPNMSGWNYGFIADPTGGHQDVVSVTRNRDNKQINVRNFWLTDRILLDNADPIYENRLNFADEFASLSAETYTIEFSPRPEIFLEVSSFNAPYDGKQFPEENDVVSPQLESIEVVFNKEIDESTFTLDDILLNCQGVEVDKSLLSIDKVDGRYFINLTNLPTDLTGYFVLTVQTTDITDNEGFTGEGGKHACWVFYPDALRLITIHANDDNMGTVTPESGTFTLGQNLTLHATAKDGFKFMNWTLGDDVIASTPDYAFKVTDPACYTANFAPALVAVEVVNNSDNGTVTGHGTGNYAYGTELTMTAVPTKDYLFNGWKVDNNFVTEEPTLTLTVTADTKIETIYESRRELKSLDIEAGWNWISVNDEEFNFQRFISTAINSVTCIESDNQRYELDPKKGWSGDLSTIVPGKSYKVYFTEPFTYKWNGLTSLVENTPINLKAGWNWIGFVPNGTMTLRDAFSKYTPTQNDILKDYNGFAIYDGGKWIGTLENMTPGTGYHYYTTNPDSFKYSDENAGSGMPIIHKALNYEDVLTTEPVKGVYPDNMTIIAEIRTYQNATITRNKNYKLLAFVDDECRGVGEYVDDSHNFITIYGTESTSSASHSLKREAPVGNIKLIVASPDLNFWDIEEKEIFTTTPQGTMADPKILTMPENITTGNGTVNKELKMFSARPNPVVNTLHLIGLTDLINSWRIITINGSTVAQGDKYEEDAGIDMSRLDAGNYILLLDTQIGAQQVKLIKK